MLPLPEIYCAPIGARSASLTVYAASILFHACLGSDWSETLTRQIHYHYTIMFLDIRDHMCHGNPDAGGVWHPP